MIFESEKKTKAIMQSAADRTFYASACSFYFGWLYFLVSDEN